ncbi:DUF4362 domain-containing protein [Methanimicrococcus sp. OttesenSCG-928-J09]|nr:DUF4362 domain-containing protein [Methanimicrococcus sp. OttesenSCG-928-J09]
MKKMTNKSLILMILCVLVVTPCTLCLDTAEPNIPEENDTNHILPNTPLEIFGAEDKESIQQLLSSYPKNMMPEEAVTAGFFVILHGVVNEESKTAWDMFNANITQGKDATVIILQYTIEGDPILNYVSFVNGSFYSVTDTSRDQWGGPNHYHDGSYQFLKQFEQSIEQTKLITVILSDIDYDTIDAYEKDEDRDEKSIYLFETLN